MILYTRPKLLDVFTMSQSKLLENRTLHSGTLLYSPYFGRNPPPSIPPSALQTHFFLGDGTSKGKILVFLASKLKIRFRRSYYQFVISRSFSLIYSRSLGVAAIQFNPHTWIAGLNDNDFDVSGRNRIKCIQNRSKMVTVSNKDL